MMKKMPKMPLLRKVKLYVAEMVLSAFKTWVSHPRGVLLMFAVLALDRAGWKLLALALFASVPLPFERGRRLLHFFGYGHNFVSLIVYASLHVLIRNVANGILGGAGVWTLVPRIVGEVLNVLALMLSVGLMLGLIVLPFLPIVEGVLQWWSRRRWQGNPAR